MRKNKLSKRSVGITHIGPFRELKATALIKETGTMKRWNYDLSGKVDRTPRFSMGVASLSGGCKSTVYGDQEEKIREKSCIVAKGRMRVKWNGKEEILNRFDYLYVPPNSEYEIEDVGSEELVYIWMMAPSLAANVNPTENDREISVIRTLKLKPHQVFLPGNERSIYEVRLAQNYNFGLNVRPAGTFAPLHTHDPLDSDEGFVVMEGKLQITDTEGKSRVLEQFDFAYVPPFGGNLNRNIGSDTAYYIYAEAPAVEIKEVSLES